MLLTRENYHSLEANKFFMSNSQYKEFLECEARALAKINGSWVEESPDAFMVGSYVHSWNENKRKEFLSENPSMFTTKGLKAPFKVADKMIATLESDPFALYVLEGMKEQIFTAELFGTPWKIMIDSYIPEKRRSVDLKTTRSITEKVWNNELWAKVSFIEAYSYLVQAAVYSEVERIAHSRPPGDWFDFYIVAVSKQDVPDKEVISLVDPERYAIELINIQNNMPRILSVKNGEVEPNYCGKCDFCRSKKRLSEAIHYTKLDPKYYGLE